MLVNPRFYKARFAAVIAAVALASGCGGGDSPETTELVNALLGTDFPVVDPLTADDPVTPLAPTPTGLINGVTSDGVIGQYALGRPPQSIGSLVLDPLNEGGDVFIIAGGSTELNVASAVLFSDIYVLSDSNGYFQLSLPQAVFAARVVVSYSAASLNAAQRQIDVIIGDALGNVSSSRTLAVQSVEVGTGEVQVSVSWDKPTDVDLFLFEPDGERIYYGNKNSDNGGSLDLDSNADCDLDYVNNENITYEGVTPPAGEYIVQVDMYNNCSTSTPTNYTVTVRVNGRTSTYSGQLGNTDDNIEVTRFQIQ